MTELHFKGKEFVYNHHLAVPHRPLVTDAGKSTGEPDLSGNLVIQGDNLHALKTLLPVYAGRIDCIFIDPPYNTGEEKWCYNDRVNAPMLKEWLNENPVGVEDGLRHEKWCAMMWPRLKLLHELLSETGSFWMTLGDDEVHRGKLLLDEIFGDENYFGEVCWHSRRSKQNDARISVSHNYVLVYVKSNDGYMGKFPEDESKFSNPDDDPRGPWTADPFDAPNIRKNLTYEIINPNTGASHVPPKGRHWRNTREKYREYLAEGRIVFGKTGKAKPQIKRYLFEARQKGVVPDTWWDDVGTATEATKQLQAIFAGSSPFETPKPTRLLDRVLELGLPSGGIILDSFAGSGTTAHATLQANKKDNGCRKFILVEMESHIAEPVTAERIRRVINGYEHEDKKIDGTGGNFTYCTLDEPIDLNKILGGSTLPAYESLASVLFHMATNRTLDLKQIRPEDFFIGDTEHERVWMLYKPDLDWLKSDDAALTLSRAREIFNTDSLRKHLVFAPARFVSEKVLKESGLNVAYVPFPHALYRIERE